MSSLALALPRVEFTDRPRTATALLLAVALFCVTFSAACSFSVDVALSDIDIVLQTADAVCSNAVLGAVLPAETQACELVANVGVVGLNFVKSAYDTWKASGAATDLQKLQAAIALAQTDLNQALSVLHVTDAHVVEVVQKWVAIVVSTFTVVLELLPKLTSAMTAHSKSVQVAQIASMLPTPETLKARWVNEVCKGGKACSTKVKVHHIRPAVYGLTMHLVR